MDDENIRSKVIAIMMRSHRCRFATNFIKFARQPSEIKALNDKTRSANSTIAPRKALLSFIVSTFILTLLKIGQTNATSQISTIWLARDSDEHDHHQPIISAELHTVAAAEELMQQKNRSLSGSHSKITNKAIGLQDSSNRSTTTESHTKNQTRIAEKRTGELLPATTNHFSLAASSLQPSIVSFENAPTYRPQIRAQRRSSSASVEPFRFKLAHIESTPIANNLTYLLAEDQYPENVSQSELPRASQWHHKHNAQVQYDEDSNPSLTNKRAQPQDSSVLIELAQANDSEFQMPIQRRQDNETTSTLTPQHQEAPNNRIEQPAIQFDDNNESQFHLDQGRRLATSNHSLSDIDTAIPFDKDNNNNGRQDRRPNHNGHKERDEVDSQSYEREPHSRNGTLNDRRRHHSRPQTTIPPSIYYLPNGDKWNSLNFDNHQSTETSLGSQRLHGGQGRLRNGRPSFEQQISDQEVRMRNNFARGDYRHHQQQQQQFRRQNREPVEEQAFLSNHLDGLQSYRPANKPNVNFLEEQNNWRQPIHDNLQFNPKPQHRTTPMPPLWHAQSFEPQQRYNSYGSVVAPNYRNPLDGPILVQHPQNHFSNRYHKKVNPIKSALPLYPSRKVSLATNHRDPFLLGPRTTGRHRPLGGVSHHYEPRGIQQQRIFSRGSNHKDFGFINGPKKKSIFSKLNDWASSSSSPSYSVLTNRDNELAAHSLENSFYGIGPTSFLENTNGPSQHRRRRPYPIGPMIANSGTYSSSNHLYPTPTQGRLNHYNQLQSFGPIEQPTVAPATSALNEIYGHRMQANFNQVRKQPIQQSQSQPSASFIPVVAMQVTRTSPAPIIAPNLISDGKFQSNEDANEINEYLEAKTGQRSRRNRYSQKANQVNWDNLSGDNSNRQIGTNSAASSDSLRQLVSATNQPETTVTKSAIFGYLPHQADGPLLQAMNVLKQMPAPHNGGDFQTNTQPSSDVDQRIKSSMNPLASASNNQNELYANQMDRSNQAVDAATPFIAQQALFALPPQQLTLASGNGPSVNSLDETQPSLALQLQANNYLQNDIAHPFSTPFSLANDHVQLPGSRNDLFNQHFLYHTEGTTGGSSPESAMSIRPIEVAHPSGQSFQQQQLVKSFLAEHQQQMAKHQQSASNQPDQPQLFAAGPAELNNWFLNNRMPAGALVFASPAGLALPSDPGQLMPGSSPQNGLNVDSTSADGQNASPDDGGASSSQPAGATASPQEESTETSLDEGKSPQVISKGKKRSSEFFANAGQLLLSALPLLLAPTLGLMFASSPISQASMPVSSGGAQVARYQHHPQPSRMPSLSPDQNTAQQQWPSSYSASKPLSSAASSNDGGIVSNASPSPLLFTPTPNRGTDEQVTTIAPLAKPSQSQNMPEEHHQSGGKKDVSKKNGKTQNKYQDHTQAHSVESTNKGVTLPALTGMRINQPNSVQAKSNSRTSTTSSTTSTTSTTTPKPNQLKGMLLTTLEPSRPFSIDEAKEYFANGHDILLELGASQANDSTIRHLFSDGTFNRTSSAPSIMILTAEPVDEQNSTIQNQFQRQDNNDRKSWSLGSITGNQYYQLAGFEEKKHTGNRSSEQFSSGYEGVDFDAQFPTLTNTSKGYTNLPERGSSNGTVFGSQKHSSQDSMQAPSQLGNIVRDSTIAAQQQDVALKFAKDKNQYKYAQPNQASSINLDEEFQLNPRRRRRPIVGLSNRYDNASTSESSQPQQLDDARSQQDDRLFPVTTWPTLRRRTVSLVTSQGNRTLYDSSSGLRYTSNTEPAGTEPTTLIQYRSAITSVQLNPTHREGHKQRQHEHSDTGSAVSPQLLDTFLLDKVRAQQQDLAVGDETNSGSTDRFSRLIKRNKRQAVNETQTTSNHGREDAIETSKKKRRKRIVLKRVKIKRRIGNDGELQVLRSQPSERKSLSTGENVLVESKQGLSNEEVMNGDSSRSKSAIVTAMITQIGDGDRDEAEQSNEEGRSRNFGSKVTAEELENESLRAELLHKKMILDRLATRASSEHNSDLSNVSDRLRSRPMTTLRGLPSSNSTKFKHFIMSDNLQTHQELPDDTRQTLAKFGNLLLEDTLELPANDESSQVTRARSRKSVPNSVRLRAVKLSDSELDDLFQAQINETLASTERYSLHSSGQPTPSPLTLRGLSNEGMPGGRASFNESMQRDGQDSSGQTFLGSYHFPARLSSSDQYHKYSRPEMNETLRTFGDRYTSREQDMYASRQDQNSPIGRYNNFLHNQFQSNKTRDGNVTSSIRLDGRPSQRLRNNSAHALEPLDARHSYNSNYSMPYNDAGGYYYSGRRDLPVPPVGPPDSHRSPGFDKHHQHLHRPPMPYSADVHQPPPHYNYSAYGPAQASVQQPTGAYYANDEYAAPIMHSSPPTPSSQPPHMGYQDPRGPPPATQYSTLHQPMDNYNTYQGTNSYGRHPNYYSAASEHPMQAFAHGASHNHANEATESADPAPSVNEYLKRVQFSDSDRDKLMASYLTCDGLLNDNDHCLERLSCEFSDPHNIEKANKLDRAVSSILLGHILINTYIPNSFKLRLKSASLFGYTQSGKCSKFACSKLSNNLKN